MSDQTRKELEAVEQRLLRYADVFEAAAAKIRSGQDWNPSGTGQLLFHVDLKNVKKSDRVLPGTGDLQYAYAERERLREMLNDQS